MTDIPFKVLMHLSTYSQIWTRFRQRCLECPSRPERHAIAKLLETYRDELDDTIKKLKGE